MTSKLPPHSDAGANNQNQEQGIHDFTDIQFPPAILSHSIHTIGIGISSIKFKNNKISSFKSFNSKFFFSNDEIRSSNSSGFLEITSNWIKNWQEIGNDVKLVETEDPVQKAGDHNRQWTYKKYDDGYNWKKYGEKQVTVSEYPRSYYKCTYPDCLMKKVEETSSDWNIIRIIYREHHNHPKPQSTKRSSSSDTSLEDQTQAKRLKMESEENKVVIKTESDIDILDDGYNTGCPVKKQVERAPDNIKTVITTYEGKHIHPVPVADDGRSSKHTNLPKKVSTKPPNRGGRSSQPTNLLNTMPVNPSGGPSRPINLLYDMTMPFNPSVGPSQLTNLLYNMSTMPFNPSVVEQSQPANTLYNMSTMPFIPSVEP
ncbi:hypothetical protein L1987_04089 [Smallanthus sonchifolius]|uniref:Uncharacterized protein n=1 Tax=Smallanthus sonchifolius TaxID=185202 RepID=A0ACB9KCG6_9ASTR|nr:hypothetical protein L1987_04089 [Smallanthus sonchifolius]